VVYLFDQAFLRWLIKLVDTRADDVLESRTLVLTVPAVGAASSVHRRDGADEGGPTKGVARVLGAALPHGADDTRTSGCVAASSGGLAKPCRAAGVGVGGFC
jgi:hypothetical protein